MGLQRSPSVEGRSWWSVTSLSPLLRFFFLLLLWSSAVSGSLHPSTSHRSSRSAKSGIVRRGSLVKQASSGPVSCPVLSCPVLCPVLSCHVLSYPVLSVLLICLAFAV